MTDTRFLEDEQSLLNELNHGSSDAFTYLYNKYYRQLCTLSCTYLQDSERAKDLVQQTFIRIWENLPSLHITASIKNYLYTLVKNASLNLLRDTGYTLVRMENPAEQLAHLADTGMQERLEREARYNRYRKAVCMLPKPKRDVFLLKMHHRLTNREIAARLDISESTVKNYYNLSLRLLRRYLKAPEPDLP